ncbi:hypothetical protein ACJJI3_11125 [Microbulbifer sp. ZKSA004]|uniref:hypothetical protein n=1 Tax=Microbulbifer sp. ZKSA004 TaxID=3243389 RepID=UPI004039C56F
MIKYIFPFLFLITFSKYSIANGFVEKSIFGNQVKIPTFHEYKPICESDFEIWDHLNTIYGRPGSVHLLSCFSDIDLKDSESDGAGGIVMLFFDNRYKDGDISKQSFVDVKNNFSDEHQKIIELTKKQVNSNTNIQLRTGISMDNISGSDNVSTRVLKDSNSTYLWQVDMNVSYELDGNQIEERTFKIIGYILVDGWPIKINAIFTDYPQDEKRHTINMVLEWVDMITLENNS